MTESETTEMYEIGPPYRGDVVVGESKRRLKSAIHTLREEERQARKLDDEEQAEKYRKAANAHENALAELETEA